MIVKLNLRQQLNILTAKKDFILFNIKDKKIVGYKLTNDLTRDRNNYKHFKVISCIKNEIINNEFNI